MPQYRDRYVFLAPHDFNANYVDIVAPDGAAVAVDGTAIDPDSATATFTGEVSEGQVDGGVGARRSAEIRVYRVRLDAGPQGDGTHVIDATKPVGAQVVGHALFTSYQYPGGLNLSLIARPPPEILR